MQMISKQKGLDSPLLKAKESGKDAFISFMVPPSVRNSFLLPVSVYNARGPVICPGELCLIVSFTFLSTSYPKFKFSPAWGRMFPGFALTRISHWNRHEMSEIPSYSRRATEGTEDVLSVRRRYPTKRNAEDVGISDIAVDSGEKCGLITVMSHLPVPLLSFMPEGALEVIGGGAWPVFLYYIGLLLIRTLNNRSVNNGCAASNPPTVSLGSQCIIGAVHPEKGPGFLWGFRKPGLCPHYRIFFGP